MLINALVSLINLIIKVLGVIANTILSILPPTPFNVLSEIQIPYVDYLNWIIPLNFMLTVLTYWVGAIAIYYVISVVLRWIKIIE